MGLCYGKGINDGRINNMIISKEPKGFYIDKRSGKFRVYLRFFGKNLWVGSYLTKSEARRAYIKAKAQKLELVSQSQTCAKIKKGLLLHSESLRLSLG